MSKIKQHLLDNHELTEIKDIAEHGCSGGIGGFIYYNETVTFHDEHEEEIWDLIYDDMREFGEAKNIIEYISKLNGIERVASMTGLKNLLCWYAVERTAYQIVK